MSTSTMNVFQSRWGFHPCSKETYQKLKYIKKCYYQTLQDFANWERWYRKEPQNRVVRKWHRDENGRKISCEIVGPRPEPNFCRALVDNRWGQLNTKGMIFVDAFDQARHPQKQEDVRPLGVSLEAIDQLYQELHKYFG